LSYGSVMIIAIEKIRPLRGKTQAILDTLQSMECPTQVENRCLGCALYLQHGNENPVLCLEQWRSWEDLHSHIQSNLYLRLLNAMELGSEAPEISFHEISDTKGLQLIEALRQPLPISNEYPCVGMTEKYILPSLKAILPQVYAQSPAGR